MGDFPSSLSPWRGGLPIGAGPSAGVPGCPKVDLPTPAHLHVAALVATGLSSRTQGIPSQEAGHSLHLPGISPYRWGP